MREWGAPEFGCELVVRPNDCGSRKLVTAVSIAQRTRYLDDRGCML